MLRNSGSDSSSLWQLAKIDAHWRKKPRYSRRQSLYLVVLAALHFAAFTVAGIFSAKVTTTSSEVLLRSEDCGTLDHKQHDAYNTSENMLPYQYIIQDTLTSSMYISVCSLRGQGSSPINCEPYTRRSPRWTLTKQRDCPFADGMCYGGITRIANGIVYRDEDVAVHLDSGPIDSTLDLGINARPKDRITLRKSLTCAPIRTTGFNRTLSGDETSELGSLWVGSNDTSGQPQAFYYGKDFALNLGITMTNATLVFNPATLLASSSWTPASPPYSLT